MAATGQLHIWALAVLHHGLLLGVFKLLVGMLLSTPIMHHADRLTEKVETSDNTVRVSASELIKLLS